MDNYLGLCFITV